MADLAIARAIHVLAVVVWIGGVAMVTTVVLPLVRRMAEPADRQALFRSVERRFIWQARIASLAVAVSGFYMVARLGLWPRFALAGFWWMHAMVGLWLLFTVILFVAEPLIGRRRTEAAASDAAFTRLQRVHWLLLGLSGLVIAAAVAGSAGLLP